MFVQLFLYYYWLNWNINMIWFNVIFWRECSLFNVEKNIENVFGKFYFIDNKHLQNKKEISIETIYLFALSGDLGVVKHKLGG